MKFVDEATITVQSGNGGPGCVSFRREKYIENGGPDGGDGGVGGDVTITASSTKRTLYQFRHQRQIKAENGKPGEGANRYGRQGKAIELIVPVGTVIINAETGESIKDFTEDGESFVIAKGGIGGRGNRKFTSSTRKAPKFAQPGMPGEYFELKLELKLLAEVGIIGFPSAGKSTLISVISSARPKIAAYHFTTLTPNLGMVSTDWGEPFAVADIPGLIEGAHEGTGLGTKFLRHIERTKILVHLVDASTIDPDDPMKNFRLINRELALYSEKLAVKRQIVVINKMDVTGAEELAEAFKQEFEGKEVLLISAATTRGVAEFKERIAREVHLLNENPEQ